jgi:F420H(2)-dependent quinone reductase
MPDYGLFGAEHVRQYEATGGKVGHDWNGAPVLVLHTTGRRSGQIRKFPPTMTALWPEYDKYQAGTKRDIPVVLLNPR